MFRHLRIFFRAKHHLRQPLAIAQIDENDAAMIASDCDPTSEFHFAADIGFAQLAAIVGSIHGVPGHSERTNKSRKRINRLPSVVAGVPPAIGLVALQPARLPLQSDS